MLANFVQETANAPGQGTVNLGGAAAGRRPFIPTFASGSTVFYGMDDGTLAEMGIGVVTAGSPNTLARTTVLWNSAGTTDLMNFLGSVRVYNAVPAERAIFLRSDGTVNNATTTGSALVRAADAAAARTAIGATATGSAVIAAADAAAARTAIGAANAAGQTFTGDIQANNMRSLFTATPTTGQIVLGNGSARLFWSGSTFDLNGPLTVDGSPVAPRPTASAGVGQVVALNNDSGASVTLPASGTWFFYVMGFGSTLGLNGQANVGVTSGGSSVAPSGGTPTIARGFAWRIQ